MNYYEMLYIVNPNFERKNIDEIKNEIESRLNKTKSKIINHMIWGKKKLAYPIQKHKYGTYIMVHYNGGNKNALDEFNSWLKLSDLVIRHMIVRLENEPALIEKKDDELNLESEQETVDGKEKKLNDNQKKATDKTEGGE